MIEWNNLKPICCGEFQQSIPGHSVGLDFQDFSGKESVPVLSIIIMVTSANVD